MKTTTALKSVILAGGLALGLGTTTIPTSAAAAHQAPIILARASAGKAVHGASTAKNRLSGCSILALRYSSRVYTGAARTLIRPNTIKQTVTHRYTMIIGPALSSRLPALATSVGHTTMSSGIILPF